jgi:DNA-binding transcriptional regulator GbsR (MarR family)
MASSLTSLEHKFVQEFGGIYESYGLKRLEGLLVGLLLTLDDPASLDDMVELLGRSKGPISTAARRLADIGVIRRVGGPVNRRNYYAAHPDIFYNNFKFNMDTVRRNRRVAEQFKAQIEAGDADEHGRLRESIEHMHDFYTLMEGFYQDFSAEWEEMKRERTNGASVERTAKGVS